MDWAGQRPNASQNPPLAGFFMVGRPGLENH